MSPVRLNPALADKPQLVVLNKMDLPEAQASWPAFEQEIARLGLPVMNISAATGLNVEPLLYRVQQMLDDAPLPVEEPPEEMPEITPKPDDKEFHIYLEGEGLWRVEGEAIERIAQMTNWDYYEAAMRFQRILRAMGITEALTAAGVVDGDSVLIGDQELEWGE